jgi:hypothetical protein
MTSKRDDSRPLPRMPWWRVRVLWLVVGGPLAVVVASFATLGLALEHPDPVLREPVAASPSQLPAVTARNHAANPVPPR